MTAVFIVWSLIAYRADSEARIATATDDAVDVTHAEGSWQFEPTLRTKSSALVFFPGALVDPRAYAPLARSVAEAGYHVLLVELPRRGAFGGAESPELRMRIAAALASTPDHHSVVVGGHSRGAVVASTLSAQEPGPAGVVLIGTSHPRDVDLRELDVPVTKIVGTRDGLASPEEVEQNANLLPDQTRWVWVEGGNHSQFGWYGFQPLDRRAEISAADQRRIMTQAVLDLLQSVDSSKGNAALLTPDGWGPLRIGMSRAEVVAAAGEDANPDAVGGSEPDRCDEFRPSKAPAGVLVMVESGILTRISVSRNSAIKTSEGLRVGDRDSAVLAEYGSRARVDPHQYWEPPAKYMTVWQQASPEADRRGIRYEIDSAGEIVHLRAGGPSIEYVEGCV